VNKSRNEAGRSTRYGPIKARFSPLKFEAKMHRPPFDQCANTRRTAYLCICTYVCRPHMYISSLRVETSKGYLLLACAVLVKNYKQQSVPNLLQLLNYNYSNFVELDLP
jgi:hypothetical protein